MIRRSKGQAREEQLIAAAAELIAERGLANVRVTDIAERAGMTPGHVTYYFPAKNELLMRAIRRSEDAFTQALELQVGAVDDPWQRLRTYLRLAAADGPGDRGWLLWFEVWATAPLDPDVARVHEELDAGSRDVLAGILRYGAQRGAFRLEDLDRTALLLSAVIDGLSVQLTLGAAGLTRPALLELCERAARALLAPWTGGSPPG
jgi:AcrR family transcriptional regulator